MTSHRGMPVTHAPGKRAKRSLLLTFAALLAAGTLSGCVVEAPGPHHGWWWYHHDRY